MPHNACHHAYFVTYTLSRDVHPDEYDEIKVYLMTYGKFYCLKAEDVDGTGLCHLHFIHIRELEEFDPNPDVRAVTMYGARRPKCTKDHILANCPLIARSIATAGGRHSLQCDPLDNGSYFNYLNKETDCHCNNLPEDMCLIMRYLSKKEAKAVDAEMAADANKYAALRKKNLEANPYCYGVSSDQTPTLEQIEVPVPFSFITDRPTTASCKYFYRYQMNVVKEKKTCKRKAALLEKASALRDYMNESVYTTDED